MAPLTTPSAPLLSLLPFLFDRSDGVLRYEILWSKRIELASLSEGLSNLVQMYSHLLLERDFERELDLDLDHDLEREREDLELVAEERLLRWSWQKAEC